MPLVLYHNPRCSNSRAALKLLEDAGKKPEIFLYLENPPSAAELKELLGKLGVGPRALMRSKEPIYKELGLADPALTDAALIRAMVENPILIERPILIAGKRAVIGRPPERVLEIAG
jgi:arsenate reductase